jgi:PAS domain S-box-containing protein
MKDRQKDLFQMRLQKLSAENDALKTKLMSQKDAYNDISRSLSRNEALLNVIPAGLVLIQDRKILRANNTFLNSIGYSSGDIIGIDFLQLIHVDQREQITKIHRLWDSGRMNDHKYDARIVSAAGASFIFEIICNRIRYQNRTAFLLILNSLEARLSQEQKKKQKEKQEAMMIMASAVKDKFVSFNNTLLKTIADCRAGNLRGDKNIERGIERLEKASANALTTIDSLEIITGSQKGRAISSFKLNDAVKEAVNSATRRCNELSEARAVKAGLKTYFRSSSFIEADFNMIIRAVYQIIINAVEAEPDGGEIHITTEDNNGEAHVYIQDSGSGISEKINDWIFDPFFSTRPGAMGLGLSIAGSIVKRYGGDIDVTSRDKEGSIFHICLPKAKQKLVVKAKNGRVKITDSQILIIQDNDVAREMLSHLLIKKGCRLDKAINDSEGLVKLKKKSYTMVIADQSALNIEMSLFIKKARNILPNLSIAIISADKKNSSSLAQKADLILVKPVDIKSAVKQVSEVLMAKADRN